MTPPQANFCAATQAGCHNPVMLLTDTPDINFQVDPLSTIAVILLISFVGWLLVGRYGDRPVPLVFRKIALGVEAIAIGMVFFFISLWVFAVPANQSVLAATIINIVVIVVVVVLDRVFTVVRSRLSNPIHNDKQARPLTPLVNWLRNSVLWWITGASWKAGLYAFYIFLLGATALQSAGADFEFINLLADYMTSVYFGLLILIAADKFAEQITKEARLDEAMARRAAISAPKKP